MARRICLYTLLLLGAVPALGQIIIPGVGYPGGGRRYPQGPPVQRQPSAPPDAIIGMLRKIEDKDVIVETDDKSITTIATSGGTKYYNIKSGKAQIGDFQPGDHVNVSADKDSKGVYHGKSMTMVWEGTAEEHSTASAAMNDTSRPITHANSGSDTSTSSSRDAPVLRRAPSSSGGAPTSTASNDDDHPHLSRSPASNSDSDAPVLRRAPLPTDQPASQPIASSDDDHPRLRRPATSDSDSTPMAQLPTAPAPSPAPMAASARPSLHADDPGGVSRLPQSTAVNSDPFIDQAREAAFAFSETLPNYIVKQYTTRYATVAQRGRSNWQALDNVTADVIEENGQEKYKNILVNGKPPVTDVEKSGSWSKGEFSTLLQDVLSPYTNADFHNKRPATIVNRAAFRYEFSVQQPNSHWHIETSGDVYMPAYSGSIWIDKENYRVLRIEMSAEGMPRSYPLDQVEWAVDYDYVLIGEGRYLLPVHSESLSCARTANSCTRNTIDFRNYRKFSADTSITFEP